jgi:hypothetical protein
MGSRKNKMRCCGQRYGQADKIETLLPTIKEKAKAYRCKQDT